MVPQSFLDLQIWASDVFGNVTFVERNITDRITINNDPKNLAAFTETKTERFIEIFTREDNECIAIYETPNESPSRKFRVEVKDWEGLPFASAAFASPAQVLGFVRRLSDAWFNSSAYDEGGSWEEWVRVAMSQGFAPELA